MQGAVAMLYAAGFGFVYRSFRVFHIAMGAQFVFSCYAFYLCASMLKLPLAPAVCGTLALSVLFAAAIEWVVYRPQRLYLLDEPSAGLSPKSAQDIIERVRRFAKEDAKRAIVMVEHRLDLLSWIDRAVFLSQGEVKAETSDSCQFLDPNWLSKNYFE